jgi:class III poly(R)-hydroxyalkanoic acid synthase PhaE subunit
MMSDDPRSFSGPHNLLSLWIQTASQFWGTMLQSWSGETAHDKTASEMDSIKKSRSQESLEAVLKTWQRLSSVASEPGAMEAFSHLTHTLPDILQKMVRAGWQGWFHLQQQWLERAGRIGQSTQAYSFAQVEEETFKAWTEIYEKEFRQFLHIPQLGLTRFYQEKFYQALDHFNLFQAAFAEYMYLFYLPMDKSFKVLQDEVAKLAEEGKLPDDFDSYYKMWIKILEGHYMNLFKSPEYLKVMEKALDTFEQFVQAKNSITQDVLKAMAVPTQNDIDDLYKEIYELKKEIRKQKKQP